MNNQSSHQHHQQGKYKIFPLPSNLYPKNLASKPEQGQRNDDISTTQANLPKQETLQEWTSQLVTETCIQIVIRSQDEAGKVLEFKRVKTKKRRRVADPVNAVSTTKKSNNHNVENGNATDDHDTIASKELDNDMNDNNELDEFEHSLQIYMNEIMPGQNADTTLRWDKTHVFHIDDVVRDYECHGNVGGGIEDMDMDGKSLHSEIGTFDDHEGLVQYVGLNTMNKAHDMEVFNVDDILDSTGTPSLTRSQPASALIQSQPLTNSKAEPISTSIKTDEQPKPPKNHDYISRGSQFTRQFKVSTNTVPTTVTTHSTTLERVEPQPTAHKHYPLLSSLHPSTHKTTFLIAVILSINPPLPINTKSSTTMMSSLILGDTTTPASKGFQLVLWRDKSKLVETVNVGDIVRCWGVEIREFKGVCGHLGRNGGIKVLKRLVSTRNNGGILEDVQNDSLHDQEDPEVKEIVDSIENWAMKETFIGVLKSRGMPMNAAYASKSTRAMKAKVVGEEAEARIYGQVVGMVPTELYLLPVSDSDAANTSSKEHLVISIHDRSMYQYLLQHVSKMIVLTNYSSTNTQYATTPDTRVTLHAGSTFTTPSPHPHPCKFDSLSQLYRSRYTGLALVCAVVESVKTDGPVLYCTRCSGLAQSDKNGVWNCARCKLGGKLEWGIGVFRMVLVDRSLCEFEAQSFHVTSTPSALNDLFFTTPASDIARGIRVDEYHRLLEYLPGTTLNWILNVGCDVDNAGVVRDWSAMVVGTLF